MNRRSSTRPETEPSISLNATPPSGSEARGEVFASLGLIVSCRPGDVDLVCRVIQACGGKLVFQTVSNGSLFILREAQIERILQGDLSELVEIMKKKKERRSEK
jgi:hypothetical protein